MGKFNCEAISELEKLKIPGRNIPTPEWVWAVNLIYLLAAPKVPNLSTLPQKQWTMLNLLRVKM